jgi:hypothetical protein
MMFESFPAFSEFASGAGGQAYNQAAFRHFLAIERRRAEASMHSVVLVLVTIRRHPSPSIPLVNGTAGAVFKALGEAVREIDFVGWFREGRVAGAVLAQGTVLNSKARQVMADRVRQTLAKRLPLHAKHLRVRVVRLSHSTERDEPAVRALSGY